MPATSDPPWARSPPVAYDIVTFWYPESGAAPGPKLRPGLVTAVLRSKSTGLFACRVAYGTKNLKLMQRMHLDVVVQNAADLDRMGLGRATRFDLDCIALLPWNERFFGCWSGRKTPVIGALTEEYVKDYAFKMMRRMSAPGT